MDKDDAVKFLKQLSDSQLHDALSEVFDKWRPRDYAGACDDYGFPTNGAELAVIKQILCG